MSEIKARDICIRPTEVEILRARVEFLEGAIRKIGRYVQIAISREGPHESTARIDGIVEEALNEGVHGGQ